MSHSQLQNSIYRLHSRITTMLTFMTYQLLWLRLSRLFVQKNTCILGKKNKCLLRVDVAVFEFRRENRGYVSTETFHEHCHETICKKM